MPDLFPEWPLQMKAVIPPADPTRNKHGGNPESDAAWQRLAGQLGPCRAEVLKVIRLAGQHGATSKEVAAVLDKELNRISGRFVELAGMGLIARKIGVKRAHAAVWIGLKDRG